MIKMKIYFPAAFSLLMFLCCPVANAPDDEEILDIELDGKPVAKPDPRKARFNVIEKAFKKRDRIHSRGI